MPEPRTRSWMRWFWVTAAVVAADLASKAWVTQAFHEGELKRITSFFDLVLVYNTGAAFSFLAGAGGWQRWFFLAVSIVISAAIVLLLRRRQRPLSAFALALVLGGALGNVYDRVTLGRVVDFIQLHAAGYYWPAFNVADSAISIGVALLLLESLGRGRETRAEPEDLEKEKG
jgi:signal peptidase II